MAEPTALRDWHTRARVRIKETSRKHSFDGEHTFQAGDEVTMVQWGRSGRTVDRGAWWTSFDIDGAWIIEASKVEVVEVLEEVSPFDEEPLLRECPYCHQLHQAEHIEACPLKPKQGNGSISV